MTQLHGSLLAFTGIAMSLFVQRISKIFGMRQTLREIYNQAWEKNWGFVPFTEAEIEYMTKELKPLMTSEVRLGRRERE